MKYSYTLIALAGAVLAYNTETPEQCADRCLKQFEDCSTGASPNYSYCASQYKSCTGDHDASSSNQPTACQSGAAAPSTPAKVEQPAPTASETPEQCADQCLKQFDDCSTGPSPNFSFCASQYKSCTGDHDASSSNQPTACQSGAAAPTTPAKVEEPAPTASETPEQCADRCLKQFDDCSTGPSPNFSFCASQYKSCTGNHDASSSNTPSVCGASPAGSSTAAAPAPTSSETPEECADRCLKQFEGCSTGPSPNFSFCASQYKSCTGNHDASSSNTPSVCGAPAAAPSDSAPSSTAAAPAPTSSETPEQCADRCLKQFEDCSTAQNPSPNFAFCASQYKSCTGNPDASSSNTPDVCGAPAAGPASSAAAPAASAPATTGTAAAPAPTSSETPEECADRCLKQFEDCSTAQNPSPNFAFCASQYKSCTGNPDASSSNTPATCGPAAAPSAGSGAGGATTMATSIAAPTGGVPVPPSGNSTIPTINGAGVAKPAMALLALGALALF